MPKIIRISKNSLKRALKFFSINLAILKWQLPICLALLMVSFVFFNFNSSSEWIESIDRSLYISLMSGLASIVSLFCSVSFAFALFAIQSSRTERIATYDLLKSKIHETQDWLMTFKRNTDREVCSACLSALDNLSMDDLPITDFEKYFGRYTSILREGFSDDDIERKEFFDTSVMRFGYIESLLSRIGEISIRQIISSVFLDTLAKGFAIVCVELLALATSALFFPMFPKSLWLSIEVFCVVSSIFFFYEFMRDLYRFQNEEIGFTDAA